MIQCFSGLHIAVFDKSCQKEAKCHPLTRSALWRSLVKTEYYGETTQLFTDLVSANQSAEMKKISLYMVR